MVFISVCLTASFSRTLQSLLNKKSRHSKVVMYSMREDYVWQFGMIILALSKLEVKLDLAL